MAARRTTPSMGRMLALLAGTAGVGFGSTAVAQHHGHDPAERPVRVRAVAQRASTATAAGHVLKPTAKPRHPAAAAHRPIRKHVAGPPKPHRPALRTSSAASAPATATTPAPTQSAASAPVRATAPVQAAAPTLQAPAQTPVAATPAPAPVVSGGS